MGTFKYLLALVVFCLTPITAFSYNNQAKSSDLSWESLKAMIEYDGLTTVEDTLAAVKQKHPEFFEKYILMYHSRSLQGSSFENPRAILFDSSAQFVFSFNGNKRQRGFDRLEIMQFRKDTNRFEFREVIFSSKGEVTFSEPNPAKCMVCHQDAHRSNIDPRPNWEPYNIWPGSYGSNSGRLETNAYEINQPRFQRMDALMLENMSREKEELEKFFSNVQPEHDRYKLLEKESYDSHLTVDITQFFANLNARRIARIMTEEWAEVYKYLEPTVLGVIKCGKLMVTEENYQWIQANWPKREYYEESWKLSHPAIKSKSQIRSELMSHGFGGEMQGMELDDIDDWVESAYKKQFERLNDYYSVDPTRGLHHVFEPFGISTADWSMDFKTDGRFAFRERFGTPGNTKMTLYNGLKDVTGFGEYKKMNCKELGAKAEEGYAALKASPLFTELMVLKKENELKASAPIIGRCVKCHTSDDPAIPPISFDDPEKLKEELKGGAMYSTRNLMDEIRYRLGDYAKENERMPMGPIVSKQQRQDLVSYLEGLLEGE